MLKKLFNKIMSGLTSRSIAGRAGKSRSGISVIYADLSCYPFYDQVSHDLFWMPSITFIFLCFHPRFESLGKRGCLTYLDWIICLTTGHGDYDRNKKCVNSRKDKDAG